LRRNEWTFRWRPLLMLAVLGVFAHAKPGAASTGKVDPGLQSVCRVVERAAEANGLPPAFLARILWQESRFHSAATSPKGAIGVAQFLPPTAAERGLADPRQPGPAIKAAAQFLADLSRRFGNLGLAAAAYNAGPGRVSKWLGGKSGLPAETRAYVEGATGRGADDWKSPDAAAHGTTAEMQGGCVAAVMLIARSPTVRIAGSHGARSPWQRHLDRILARAATIAAHQGEGSDAFAAARNLAYGE
jgi:hypothetical protein